MQTIEIDLVGTRGRFRASSPEQVERLKASIAEVGLLSPITVHRGHVQFRNILRPGFCLIAGLHRLEACKALGHTEIKANVVDLEGLDAVIAQCDENLIGAQLTPAQRAVFTRNRKEAYEAKHPMTRHGAVGNGRQKSSQLGNSTNASFVDDTAARTGLGKTTIARDAQRGSGIADEVLERIESSPADKGVVLDQLASLPRERQAEEAERLIIAASAPRATEARKTTKPRGRRAYTPPPPAKRQVTPYNLDGDPEGEKWLAEGRAWWARANPGWRTVFLHNPAGLT